MKKSFLRRAMAAAIAVPVALTQTLVCATGFAADETAAAADAITLTAADLMAVEADTAKNTPVLVEETETTRTYKQESSWNQVVYGALASVAANNPTINLDTVALAESIKSTAWYADVLKKALVNGGSAKVDVTTTNTVVTIDVNYDYAADLEAVLEEKLGGVDLAIDVAPVTGQIVLTANTGALAAGTQVTASATANIDGQDMGAEETLEYAKTKLAEVRAQAEEAAAIDADAAAQVAALFDSYESKLASAEAKLDKVNTASKEKSYEADSYDAVLAAVKAEYAENAYVQKLPDTVAGVMENGTVSAVFTEVLAQINAAMTDYQLDVTPGSVAEIVSAMYGVSVYGAVDAGVVNGATSALADDDIADAEYEALFDYFVDLEAAKGLAILEGSFATVKVVDAAANATVAELSGALDLTIDRVITYEVAPEEETTTTTTETTTSDVSETTTTDTTSGSETTTTDTSDTSDTTGTETTDTSDTSDTTGTETTDTSDTSDTSDTTGTETTDTSDTSDTTGTETTDTSDTSDTTETTTTDTSDTSDTSDTTETTTESVTITATAKTANFYFSHDDTVLTAEMLLDSAEMVVTVDGVAGAPVDVMENIVFGVTPDGVDAGLTPEMVYDMWGEPYAVLPIYAYYVDPDNAEAAPALIDVDIKIYVGVKGDATLDGSADAKDAANILIYAASVGAGNRDAVLYTAEYPDVENFAFFLGDVNTELTEKNPDELNAADSAKILMFAAWYGKQATPANGDIKAEWATLMAPQA